MDSSYTFSKNLQFLPVSTCCYLFLEIFRLQLRKGTISTHGLQPWSISVIATNYDKKRARLALVDASSVIPEIDPFVKHVKSCWFQFPFLTHCDDSAWLNLLGKKLWKSFPDSMSFRFWARSLLNTKANEEQGRSTRPPPPPLIVPSKTSVSFKPSESLVIFI